MLQFQHYFQHYQVTVKGTCFNFPPDLTTVPFDGCRTYSLSGGGEGGCTHQIFAWVCVAWFSKP